MPADINGSAGESSRRTRVCMVSQRNIRKMAAWCSLYEFEDVIAEIDDVQRIDLAAGPAFPLRKRAVMSLVWRQYSSLSARINPGLRPVTIDTEHDLFFFGCINPWELLLLNGVRGWKERCRKKICYMYEMWAGVVPRYVHLLQLLNGFDHVIFGWESSARAVQKVVDVPCHHLSPAVDTVRFSPFPQAPPRSIDVYSLGRRVESLHRQLVERARAHNFFYVYDTIPGEYLQPNNHVEHRELFANLAKRTRFFLTYPAKVDRLEETLGISEAGTRFYEAVAAGAIMTGRAPDSAAFKSEFNWPDSVIPTADSVDDLIDLLVESERDPVRFAEASRRNSIEALRRHDWAHRWRDILALAGESVNNRWTRRTETLNQLTTAALSAAPAFGR
jgi:hypothetical protein